MTQVYCSLVTSSNFSGTSGKLGMKCSLLLVKPCLLLLGPVSLPVRMPWSIQKSL